MATGSHRSQDTKPRVEGLASLLLNSVLRPAHWLRLHRSEFWVSALILLVLVGLMNVVHVITFLRPHDGARWAMADGALQSEFTELDPESIFQVGDVLLQIDGIPIDDIGEYEEFLYNQPIGSRHLYVISRNGERFEPWVVIQGIKDVAPQYYIFATTGFIYLIFALLILNQRIRHPSRTPLIIFSLCVFLAFVFHHTQRLTLLDWIAFSLDHIGRLLLPSAMLSVMLVGLSRTRPRQWALNSLHWIPSFLLLFSLLAWLFFATSTETGLWSADFFTALQDTMKTWSGSLIALALVLALSNRSDPSAQSRAHPGVWLLSWLPFMVTQWGLELPGATLLAGLLPTVLPISILVHWSRHGDLHLASIGRKAFVYITSVLILFLVYFAFIVLFQTLLGSNPDQVAQTMFSGFGIMFAAISYTPLKEFCEDALNRLVYGKRFAAMKNLLDLTEINRADTDIHTFLRSILHRIQNAFDLDEGRSYRSSTLPNVFTSENHHPLVFHSIPSALMNGQIVRMEDIWQYLMPDQSGDAPSPNDWILPLRVGGTVPALIVLPHPPDGARLSPDEINLLNHLINQCEILMENMQLFHTLEQKAQSIAELMEYNENIIESSRVGILTTGEDGRCVSCNAAFVELIGMSRPQLLGRTLDELLTRVALHSPVNPSNTAAHEGTYRAPDGRELLLDIRETPLKTRRGKIYGSLFLLEDITERKRIQAQLMQQEKLASIGFLAAGVAHEINTPLTGIISYSQILKQSHPLNESQRELIQLVEAQSRRAAGIVKDLLNFSRKEGAPKGPLSLNDVLEQTAQFLHHQLDRNQIELEWVGRDKSLFTHGYANSLQQVFLNIMVNAIDAMPGGGRLTITLEQQAEYNVIAFRDMGVGMDAKTRERILDPFFTTKEPGKGTGLGLSVVFNILQNHDGHLEVESQPGVGSCLTVYLPTHPVQDGPEPTGGGQYVQQ